MSAEAFSAVVFLISLGAYFVADLFFFWTMDHTNRIIEGIAPFMLVVRVLSIACGVIAILVLLGSALNIDMDIR